MNTFLIKSSFGIAVAALMLLIPFGTNNFIQGRHLLGFGCIIVTLILLLHTWQCRRDNYQPLLVLLGLLPATIFFLSIAYRDQGIVGALWSYPAVITFYFILPTRMAGIAGVTLLAITIPQAWLLFEHALAIRIAITLLTVSVFTAISMHVITLQQNNLEKLVVTDSLTGLYNRTLLESTLQDAVHQSRRLNIPMTLITLDVDHFKSINDNFGHAAGDRVLNNMADLLNEHMRRSDKIFRIGGEEFVALLYDAILDHGSHVADTLRNMIEEHSFIPEHAVTASIGVATLLDGEDWSQWMKRSDDNLYKAKSAGRNQVVT